MPGLASAQAQQRSIGDGSDVNLPTWAAPNHAYEPPPSSKEAPPPRNSAETNVPAPPRDDDGGPPDPVPLGGLEWLALAGGAYAVNRMRRRGDGDASDGKDAIA